MRLHDLLDRVATADEPVSRLDAEALFAGGERRRRRRRVARGAGAVGAVALAVAVVVVVSTVGGVPRTESEPPADARTDTFMVHAAGAHDRNHLWVWGEPAAGAGFMLASTSDGGRSWTRYNEPTPGDQEVVIRNIGLLHAVDGPSGVSAYTASIRSATDLRYTLDGWRTSHDVSLSSPPAANAPAGGLVFCDMGDDWIEDWTCTVSVFDPAGRTYASLANQPALRTSRATRAPDGVIWAAGLDRSTNKPAAARSTDGGATWSTHVFTELPAHGSLEHVLNGSLRFNHEGAALLTVVRGGMDHVARFADGRWQRLADINPSPGVATWLTADGTHVHQVVQSSQPSPAPSGGWSPPPMINKVVGVRVCPPGSTEYRDVEPPKGLPTEQAMTVVKALRGGGYLGSNYSGIWFSPDGRTWQRVPSPK